MIEQLPEIDGLDLVRRAVRTPPFTGPADEVAYIYLFRCGGDDTERRSMNLMRVGRG